METRSGRMLAPREEHELPSGHAPIRVVVATNLSSRISDDHFHTYWSTQPLPFPQLAALRISLRWKDQGWGNIKGRIKFHLLRSTTNDSAATPGASSETIVATLQHQPSRRAAHHWETKEVVLTRGERFVADAQQGDRIACLFVVGGGGGHQLLIQDMTMDILPVAGWAFYKSVLTVRSLFFQQRAFLPERRLPQSEKAAHIVSLLLAAVVKQEAGDSKVSDSRAADVMAIENDHRDDGGLHDGSPCPPSHAPRDAPSTSFKPNEVAKLCHRLVHNWDESCEAWGSASFLALLFGLPDLPFREVCHYAFGEPRSLSFEHFAHREDDFARYPAMIAENLRR